MEEKYEDTNQKAISIFREVTPLLRSFIVCIEDFDIGKKLGTGAFGEVFIGTHEPTGYECAIKKLLFRELVDDDLVLFKREIEILIKCQNPFCLPIVGWTAYYPYSIITQYEKNGSLYDHLYRKKYQKHPLKPTELSFIMYGIAAGMMYIHSLGILHRDLKSMNILLDNKMFPLICDFGLSRAMPEEASLLTKEIGTPNWMAPELMDCNEYTEKIDVYAYGMVICEMINKAIPFGKEKEFEIRNAVLDGKRPTLNPQTPTKLRKFVEKCWAQKPENRPTFAAIVKELKKGSIVFAGTDVDIYKSYIAQTDKEIVVLQSKGDPKPPLFSEASLQRAAIESASKLRPRFDRISNVNAPEYMENFNACARDLNFQNAPLFFSNLRKVFNEEDSNDLKKDIYRVLIELFSKKKSIVMAFSESGIIEDLPKSPEEDSQKVMELIMTIVNKSHDSLTKPMLSYLNYSLSHVPYSVFCILAKALVDFSSAKTEWDALDFTLDCSYIFLDVCPTDYMRLLYSVFLNEDVYKTRINELRKIIVFALRKNTEASIEAYKMAIRFIDDNYVIPSDILAHHLETNAFYSYAISYILHRPAVKATNDLIIAFTKRIETNNEALTAFIQMIVSHKSTALAVYIANEHWLGIQTIGNQTKATILAALFSFTKLRERIVKEKCVIEFLAKLAKSSNRTEKAIAASFQRI